MVITEDPPPVSEHLFELGNGGGVLSLSLSEGRGAIGKIQLFGCAGFGRNGASKSVDMW
ncbi:hypothetical protein LUPAC07_03517 [Micromonospora noduli]|nr:hypothetical protein LUPAC07_03517 [Micromonospora noduli]